MTVTAAPSTEADTRASRRAIVWPTAARKVEARMPYGEESAR